MQDDRNAEFSGFVDFSIFFQKRKIRNCGKHSC